LTVAALRKTPTPFELLLRELEQLCPKRLRRNENLKTWTTFHCNALAAAIVSPRNVEELCGVMKRVAESSVEWKVIGRGSNLLVRDGGYPGVLIDLSEGFDEIEEVAATADTHSIRVGGSVPNGTLLQWLKTRNLTGFGFSFGLPGTIGGGIRMNAGTPLGCFADLAREVEGVAPDGTCRTIAVTPADFVYRDFPKGHDLIVTAATLEFTEGAAEHEIEAAKSKRENQPLDLPNFGSVFKNPQGTFAGKLIEDAGLKGYRIGDAQISPRHANFIVNLGTAKTSDALALMKHAQKTVKEKFSVDLMPEVHVIGVDR
jgi:UDP-N-acetylmuramate dehydrogenase